MKQRASFFQRLSSTQIVYLVALVTLILGVLLVNSIGRSFFSPGNISSILTGTSVLGFIAIGQTLVILAGSLDLSVPYVTSLASLIAAGVMANNPNNVLSGVLLTLGTAAVIGLANGLIVARLNVHGFIATLGVGLIISGYLATNFKGSFGQTPLAFRLVGATGIGPVPISTIIMLACAGLAGLLLHRTRVGHHLYAVGGDIAVARTSGIRVDVPVITAHVICSVLAGMAGLLLASRLGVGSPTVGSQGGYDLLSIAAVVLGGHVALRRQGDYHRHPRRRADLCHVGQHHVRHAGQPVPEGCGQGRSHRRRRRRLRPSPDRQQTGTVPRKRVRGNARGPACARGGAMSTALNSERSAILKQNRASRSERLLRAVRTPGGAVFVLLIGLLATIIVLNPSFGEPGSFIRFVAGLPPLPSPPSASTSSLSAGNSTCRWDRS